MDCTIHTTSGARRPIRRAAAGFTLVELLVTSAIAAILLTAVAYATFQFAFGIAHLEEKAGVADAEEAVLRVMTRDAREAWWAEVPNSQQLLLADTEGNITEYRRNGVDLEVERPNGDVGVLYTGLVDLIFQATGGSVNREGTAVDFDGPWFAVAEPVGTAVGLDVPVGGELSLAFTTPVDDEQVPGAADGDEQILTTQPAVAMLPVAWIPGSQPEDLVISVYETRALGSAQPFEAALGSVSIAGASLPAAVWDGFAWEAPTSSLPLSVSGLPNLQPGGSYALVMEAGGDAQLVMRAKPVFAGTADDDVALKTTVDDDFVTLPLVVPFSLSGPYSQTTTASQQVVQSISITIVPGVRPSMTRSAALVSQSLTDDPWYGVIPNEAAP